MDKKIGFWEGFKAVNVICDALVELGVEPDVADVKGSEIYFKVIEALGFEVATDENTLEEVMNVLFAEMA